MAMFAKAAQDGKLGDLGFGGGNVNVDEKGVLTGPDNKPVKLTASMTEKERKKMVKEVTDKTKAYVN